MVKVWAVLVQIVNLRLATMTLWSAPWTQKYVLTVAQWVVLVLIVNLHPAKEETQGVAAVVALYV